jgi:PAS domain S-box-containing protein
MINKSTGSMMTKDRFSGIPVRNEKEQLQNCVEPGNSVEELRKVNEELRQARRAALNLMEDAILSKESRRQSEEKYRTKLEKEIATRTAEAMVTQEVLRAVIDSSLYVIQAFRAVRDENGRIVDFTWIMNNKNAIEQYGHVIGKSLLKQNPGMLTKDMFQKFIEVTETGIAIDQEQFYGYGQVKGWFRQTLVKMGDGFVMNTHDITARRLAEEEILKLKDEITQHAEDKYRVLFASIDEGFALTEALFSHSGKVDNYRFLETNPAFIKLMGFDNATGRLATEINMGFVLKMIGSHEEVIKTGATVSFESRNDHSKRWLRVQLSRVPHLSLALVAIVVEDITDRKKAEITLRENREKLKQFNESLEQLVVERTEALQESTSALQSVLENTNSSIMTLKAVRRNGKIIDFEFLYLNRKTLNSVSRDRLVGKRMMKNFPEMKDSPLFDSYVNVVEKNQEYHGEVEMGKPGSAIWAQVFARKLNDGLAVTYFDITVRKIAEMEFAKQQILLNESEKIGNMGSWERNVDTGELLWSDELYRIYGIQPRQVKMTTDYYINNFVHPDDRLFVHAHVKNIYEKYSEEPAEYRVIHPGGTRIVLSKAKIGFFANGKVEVIRGIVRDITAQKEAEKEVLRLRLEQQRETLNVIISAQEAERRRLGEELHDGVGQLLYATMMKQDQLEPTDVKSKLILQEAKQILNEAITQTRSLSFQLVPAVLKDYGLHEAALALISRLTSSKLRIQLAGSGFKTRISENLEFSIYRILQELLNNVIKHSKATQALVSADLNGRELVIKVQDNGIGFDTSLVSKLHKGIGLQSIFNRVKLVNGKIEFASRDGKGTTVTVQIKASSKKRG